MSPSNESVLREHLIGCAKDVLSSYDLDVDNVEVSSGGLPDPKLASVIGFDGDGIHGQLGLVAPVAVMRSSYPVPSRRDTASDADVQGWAGELANQLLGKLKRKLLLSGLDIQTSLPRSVAFETLPPPSDAPEGRFSLHLRATSGQAGLVELWLDAVLPDNIDLASSPGLAAAVLAEGEALLF